MGLNFASVVTCNFKSTQFSSKFYFGLKGRGRKEIFHLLVQFPDTLNCQGWIWGMLGAWGSILHGTWVAGTQLLLTATGYISWKPAVEHGFNGRHPACDVRALIGIFSTVPDVPRFNLVTHPTIHTHTHPKPANTDSMEVFQLLVSVDNVNILTTAIGSVMKGQNVWIAWLLTRLFLYSMSLLLTCVSNFPIWHL